MNDTTSFNAVDYLDQVEAAASDIRDAAKGIVVAYEAPLSILNPPSTITYLARQIEGHANKNRTIDSFSSGLGFPWTLQRSAAAANEPRGGARELTW